MYQFSNNISFYHRTEDYLDRIGSNRYYLTTELITKKGPWLVEEDLIKQLESIKIDAPENRKQVNLSFLILL